MLNVVCFLWGGWCYPHGVTYVNKLYRAATRNLSRPHSFTCFFDGQQNGRFEEGINVRRLVSPSWLGKLPKITAFNPEHGFEDRVLVLDLDCVITGSLDDVANYDGDFCARAWYKGIERGKWVLDGDTIGFRVGYGIDTIWEPFRDHPQQVEKWTGGRERYWYRLVVEKPDMWQKFLPGQFVSYKNHCRDGKLPPDARIVSFHGDPRPHVLNLDWLKEHWV